MPGKSFAIAHAAGVNRIAQLLLSHAYQAACNRSRHALSWVAAGERVDTMELVIEHGKDVNTLTKGSVVGKILLLASCGSRNGSIKNGGCKVAHEEGRSEGECLRALNSIATNSLLLFHH